jgi:hypothetical protein
MAPVTRVNLAGSKLGKTARKACVVAPWNFLIIECPPCKFSISISPLPSSLLCFSLPAAFG